MRGVMEENDDVRTPSAMVDDDDRSTRSSRMEFVERRWFQEGLESWKGLNLGYKLVSIIQKLPLLYHKMAKCIHPQGAIVSAIIVAVL
jgi:hypothetical protein